MTTRKHRTNREISDLSLLYEISRRLEASSDPRDEMQPILDLIADYTGMVRGTVTLLNRQTNELAIEAAHGLSERQRALGRYRPGEGITGKVVATGEPLIVPHISGSPDFLDRTGARADKSQTDLSFICVPIKIKKDVIGALSVDRPFTDDESLDDDVRLLSVIASMISQAARIRREAQEERQALEKENQRLQSELQERFHPSNMIGSSGAMRMVYSQISQVADGDTTVLIRGESGVGKELVAAAIHYHSSRSNRPFIRVNCAALPESVIESELFGHEKGAFTGAINERKGRFELADRGTIFLDEIGDLSRPVQVKILRVLQEREFERVGGSTTIRSDVRIIAATHRDLESMVNASEFRQDLFYRLNVFPIHIPPLRERRADILDLANFFIERYNKLLKKNVKRISTPTIDMLTAYHWPGNVRELENVIERAMVLSVDGVLHSHQLPPTLQTAEASRTQTTGPLQEKLDRFEREMIVEALKVSRGNMARAARELGFTDRQMGVRMTKYEIDPKRFRTTRRPR